MPESRGMTWNELAEENDRLQREEAKWKRRAEEGVTLWKRRAQDAESGLEAERAQRGKWAKTLEGAVEERDRLESECERLRGLVEGAFREGWYDGLGGKPGTYHEEVVRDWGLSKAKGLLEGPEDPAGAE